MLTQTPRRSVSVMAAIGAQVLAFAALAQTPPDTTTPRQPHPDRGMPSATTERGDTRSSERTTMKSVSPEQFAAQAAVIGKAEIELGQMALQKSQNENVRKYAQRMVKDHSAADAKLQKIAAQEQLMLPKSLDAEHQAVKQKLSGLQGEEFDREYTKAMAKGHDKAVALFESASQTPQMPSELKEFAASTLPTLEQHKEMAHSLHGRDGA
jgi:putative membrane protein